MNRLLPRKKQGSDLKPVLWGILPGQFLCGLTAPTQKGRTWVGRKSHAAKAADQVVEPEAGRMIQTQINNLVNGVVPCPARITDATNDRVGTCGAKLHERVRLRTPVAGRPTASLPVRPQFASTARTWQARLFLPRKGSPAGEWFAPEGLNTQVPDMQCGVKFQLVTSLLRLQGGWFANHTQQREPGLSVRLQSWHPREPGSRAWVETTLQMNASSQNAADAYQADRSSWSWLVKPVSAMLTMVSVMILAGCSKTPATQTRDQQTSAVEADAKPTPEGIKLQSEARPSTGLVLKDEDLHFSMTIPDGFRDYPQGIQFPETKYFYLKGTIGKDETVTIINIKKLDGLLSPDLALNRKRLREQLPAHSELTTKQWHGLTIDAYTMSANQKGSSILIYTMRVPLKPAAIEIAVGGSASRRDELNSLAEALLASLEGKSNW